MYLRMFFLRFQNKRPQNTYRSISGNCLKTVLFQHSFVQFLIDCNRCVPQNSAMLKFLSVLKSECTNLPLLSPLWIVVLCSYG